MDSSALDIAISALEKEISGLELSIDGLEKWLWVSSAAVAVGVIFEIALLNQTAPVLILQILPGSRPAVTTNVKIITYPLSIT